ncbi:u-box domain-containing protein 4 [Hordeum vulgare]|nr:u-box domain-containing protein 4 [Hordeum vulgare]
MDKGKEVVTPLDKGKEVVPLTVDVLVQDHPNAERRNYTHYHEEGGPTHFCKVIFDPKLEDVLLPLYFMKHFLAVPTEFSLKTNTGCSWRVTVKGKVKDVQVTFSKRNATVDFLIMEPNKGNIVLGRDFLRAMRGFIDVGWATFAAFHQVKTGYMLTFKLLTPNTMKVIIFNDDDVEVVTKCKKHNEASVMTA